MARDPRMTSNKDRVGANVAFSESGCDVHVDMRAEKSRQSGMTDGANNNLRGHIVPQCMLLVNRRALQSGSSRDTVSAGPQTTALVSQSVTTNHRSLRKQSFPGNERVVDLAAHSLVECRNRRVRVHNTHERKTIVGQSPKPKESYWLYVASRRARHHFAF
jgi:hypothetical protein